MRQLVLHVGSIKTGSTSAQTTFAASRPALAAHGVHYASISRNHGAVSRIIRAVRRNGMPDDPAIMPARAQEASDFKLMRKAAAEAAAITDGTYLFSSEALLTHSRRNVELLKEIVARLFPGYSVRILAYIRHPVGYTISRGQNEIKLGTETTAGVEARGYDGELRAGIETYAGVFGREAMIVRSYDAVVAAGRSVQEDMLAAIGHPAAAEGLVVERSNESISMNAALVCDIVNPALAARGIRVDTDLRRAKKQLLSEIGGPRFAFSAEALARVVAASAPEAAWFSNAYGIELIAPGTVTREEIAGALMPPAEVEAEAERVLGALLAIVEGRSARRPRKAGRRPRRRAATPTPPAAKGTLARLFARIGIAR